MKRFTHLLAGISLLFLTTLAPAQELSPVWPKNNQQVSEPDILVSWNKAFNALSYNFELFADPNQENLLINATIPDNFFPIVLEETGTYYWRIQPIFQDEQIGSWSNIYSFDFFNPTSVKELIVWFNASNSSSSGGKISMLTDLSGNNFHATQANPINQPTLISESINDKPSIRFNGLNNFLESPFGKNYAQPNSIFVLWRTDVVSSRVLLDDFSNLILDISTGPSIRMFAGTSLQYAKPIPFNFLITSALYNSTISQLFENGQLKASGNSGSNSLPGLSIGRRKVFTDRYFSGDIAELIVINKNPDPIERNKIERYIAYKYSSPVNLGFDLFAENFCPQTLDAGERFVSYLWNTGETTRTIEINTPGTYSVTVTDIFGFQSSDQVLVSYPSTDLNDTEPFLCLGESREIFPVLNNPHLYTYQWSTGATTPSLQVSESGNYWVQITDDQGCTTFSDTLHLTIDEFVNNISLGEDLSICAGNPISLIEPNEPVEIVSYLWSTGENSANIIISESGNYAVTVTNINGCVATDDIDINILGIAPLVNFDAENFCLGNVVDFTDLSVAPEGDNIVQWHWNFGEGSISSEQNPSFIFPGSGSYNVTLWVEAESTCSNTAQQTITIFDIPNTLFSTSEGCVNYPVFFQDLSSASFDSNIIDWQWDFGDGNSSSDQNPTHSYLNPGIYEVKLTTFNSNGCFSDYTINIEIPQTLPTPDSFFLISPKNEQLITNSNVVFHWNFSENAFSYVLTVAEDKQMNNIIANVETNDTHIALELTAKPQLFWRIQAYNACRDTIESDTFSFSIFNPGNNDNLVLWLAADSLVQSTNGKVDVWSDLSGKNQHATQTNPANQPILVQNAINQYPAIKFSGTEFMRTTLNQTYNFPTTIFLVWKAEGSNLQFAVDGLDINTRRAIYTQGSPNNRLGMQTSSNLQYEKQLPFNYIITTSVFNFASSRIFENSFLKATGNPGVEQPLTGLFLGSNFALTSRLNGAIAEIIVYSSVLSDTQRTIVEKYLQAKYAPPVNLGPDRRILYGFCPVILDAGERFVSYLWSNGATTRTIEVNTPGLYSVEVTDIFGFRSSDTLRVRFPETGLNTASLTLCEGESGVLEFLQGGKESEGGSYAYLWSTGATTSSIAVALPGNYTLTVTDTLGCSRPFTAVVQVDDFPSTASLGDDRPYCMGDPLSLTHTPGDAAGYTYLWSTGATTAAITIAEPGTYSLAVSNANGCSASPSVTLSFQGYAPVLDFASEPVCLGEPSLFLDLSSVEGADIVSQQWQFGDPGQPLAGASGSNASHTYSQAGIFPLLLEVSSSAGCSSTLSRPVQVYHLPQSFFTPNNACERVPLQLLDASTDSEGGIVAHQWSFYNAQGQLIGTAAEANPSFTFPEAGTYSAALQVQSQVGCTHTRQREINVRHAPQVAFNFTTPCLGDAVFFTDLTTAPAWAQVSSQRWDFGDGGSSLQRNPSHLYQQDGVYPVSLQVQAVNGCVVSIIQDVTVHSKPVADFLAPELCADTPHTFTDLSSVANSSIAQWQWNFAEQASSTQQNPSHRFSQPGLYTISLTATSLAGCASSISKTTEVHPLPVPDFSFFPRFGVAPLQVNFTNNSSGASNYVWIFGDGSQPATTPNATHTFVENGIYNTRLVAISPVGCADTLMRQISVIPLSVDIGVQEVAYTLRNGYMQVHALLTNQGTLELDSLLLEYQINGRPPIRESWTGLLRPGQTKSISFNAQIPFSEQYEYLCVQAMIPGLEQDKNPANDRRCLAFGSDFNLLSPYPVPAENTVRIGFVLPVAERVSLSLTDIRGHAIGEPWESNAEKGINFIDLPINHLRSGIYIYRLTYRDKTQVGRIMVR